MPEHENLAGYVLGMLDEQEAATFEEHLAVCDECRAEVDDLTLTGDWLAFAEPDFEVPADLQQKTLSAVREQAGRARASRRYKLSAVLGAAAVAVAVVVATALPRGANWTQEFSLAAEAGPARGVARVFDGPDGREVVLEVSNLPQSPPGTFFECWFVGEGDSLENPNRVSAGTFRVGPSGRATVRMTSSADPNRFPKMGVTLEPDDGNPKRTGNKVLVTKSVRRR